MADNSVVSQIKEMEQTIKRLERQVLNLTERNKGMAKTNKNLRAKLDHANRKIDGMNTNHNELEYWRTVNDTAVVQSRTLTKLVNSIDKEIRAVKRELKL